MMHTYEVHLVNGEVQTVEADDVDINFNVLFFKNSETKLQRCFSLYTTTYWLATDL
jgi:hypothetical protein